MVYLRYYPCLFLDGERNHDQLDSLSVVAHIVRPDCDYIDTVHASF
jgi:hypothetical protein